MAKLFAIEIIKFTHDELIIKAGDTVDACLKNKPLVLKINRDRRKPLDLYSTLSTLRDPIEQYLSQQQATETMFYRFPDGQLPITRL
jgi:hypothetical protein